jgi:glycosyltransferase involved in cell wall biosynthesis
LKTLIFCAGSGGAERARRHTGAELLAWDEAAGEALQNGGITHLAAKRLLTPADREAADEAAIAWTRRVGKQPVLEGKSFRELYSWEGVSLWWFAELYLHHSTGSPRRVRLIEAFERILEKTRPDEVEALGLTREEALLLSRTCTARGVLFQDAPGAAPRARAHAAWRAAGTKPRPCSRRSSRGWRAARRAGTGAEAARVFLSHAAFWRERSGQGGPEEYEHYFDRLIPAAAESGDLEPVVVAVGPRAAFRRRGGRERVGEWLSFGEHDAPYLHINRFVSWHSVRAVLAAGRRMRTALRELRALPALRECFSHRGVRFFDLAAADLAGTLLLQIPWAVRSYEDMSQALRELRPAVVCLYAESSGWGRAAVAACRARGVPSVGIQHGILYPTYYSYRHEADEADCPRPDKTAVFGEAARRFLIEAGRYAPESLVVTGSSKFDELLLASRTWDRARIRAELGVSPDERLIAVASRFRGIRETHQSIGSAFPALLRAVERLERARLLIKPHPAESTDGYARVLQELGASRARLLDSRQDLMRLLFAADLLVTVESLSAVEALVLGKPVVVLNMPTNLQEMVDAGAALGVPEGQDPGAALLKALEDAEARERLATARRAYLNDVASGVDGRATERLLELLRATAGRVGPA